MPKIPTILNSEQKNKKTYSWNYQKDFTFVWCWLPTQFKVTKHKKLACYNLICLLLKPNLWMQPTLCESPVRFSSPRKRGKQTNKKTNCPGAKSNKSLYPQCTAVTTSLEFQNGRTLEVLGTGGKKLGVLSFCFCHLRAVLAYNCGLIICEFSI